MKTKEFGCLEADFYDLSDSEDLIKIMKEVIKDYEDRKKKEGGSE